MINEIGMSAFSIGVGDKILHIIVSFCITMVITGMLASSISVRISVGAASVIAIFMLMPVSVIKESIDAYKKNNFFDLSDIMANYIGGFLCMFMCVFAEKA